MQTTQYRQSRIWKMNEDKYTKSLAKNQVCAINSNARYSEKRFNQIYKALNGDAMLVSLSGAQYGQRKPTFFSFPTKCVNSSLEELIKIKVIFILRQGILI